MRSSFTDKDWSRPMSRARSTRLRFSSRKDVSNSCATSNSERGAEAKKLLEWGFTNFKKVPIFDAGEIVGEARVWGGSSYYVSLIGDGPVTILVPRVANKNKLKAEIIYDGPLKPPIKKGDRIARIRVEHAEAGVNEVPLYAAEDVEEGGIIAKGLDAIILKAFGWLL